MTSDGSDPVRGRTLPLIEQAIGVLLGAEPQTAQDAVELLAEQDLLGDGLALHALLVASRKGTDPATAIGLIAEGGLTAGNSSEYERRAARAEAQEEARDALADPQRCATAHALMREAAASDLAASWQRRLEAAVEGVVDPSMAVPMTGVRRPAAAEPLPCSDDYLDLLAVGR